MRKRSLEEKESDSPPVARNYHPPFLHNDTLPTPPSPTPQNSLSLPCLGTFHSTTQSLNRRLRIPLSLYPIPPSPTPFQTLRRRSRLLLPVTSVIHAGVLFHPLTLPLFDVGGEAPPTATAARNTPAVPQAQESPFRSNLSAFRFLHADAGYKEIKRGTVGFSRIIRNGPNGAIYRAQFSDGLVSVVKKVAVSEQGKDAFHRELEFLGHLHHRHLIKLQGFSEERDRFLVYDYMENGSLKEFLHDPLRTPLNWRRRLQIAIDIAAALEYLYSFCDPPVYNVTISADNIMLDRNFVAKLSPFESLSSDGCQVHGSNGENLREHVDQRERNILFQFGVLILELVTGQSFGSEGKELMQWIQQSNITHSMHNMVDSDLGSTYNPKELKSLLTIARLCTKVGDEPVISISQVLRYLQRKELLVKFKADGMWLPHV
ncbi:hypothetical protein Taro_056423 [Colocasia esculenta]|uniref:Protein kinase domain-containing protein n=1 Tax=Colocasia esculenta TaxID=4460 RepID=A0A843XTW7_COLES|nr:hypothetical protein [Colocasia esculenta]